MAQVFGPDTFTVGADTNIDAYPAGDPDYTYNVGSGADLTVVALDDRIQGGNVTNAFYGARVSQVGMPTGSQEVIADGGNASADNEAIALIARAATAGDLRNLYRTVYNESVANEMGLTRLDNGTAVSLATTDRGLLGAATRRHRARAIGAGSAVALEYQVDDVRPLSYSDTAANRKTSGVPGIGLVGNNDATVPNADNLSIDDLAATGFQARCGTLSVGTGAAGTTYSAIALGFQPKVLILWWTRRNGNLNAAGDADVSSGFGVAVTAIDRRCIAWQDDHTAATMATDSYHSDAACVATLLTNGTVDGLADLQSLDADGFTLVVDDAFAAAISVNYLALGGADLTNMATGVFTEPGATGNHNEGALAFQPDFVLFFSAGIGNAPPGAATTAQAMVGAARSSTARGVTAILSRDNIADSDTYRYSIGTECVALMATGTGATDYREDFVAFTSTGFTLNAIERNTVRRVHYLALKGGSYRVDNLLTQTDITTDITETGFGFRPRGVFFASHGTSQSTADTPVAEAMFSMGAFDSQSAIDPARNRVARCTKHEDASTAADAGDAMRFDAVYAHQLVTTGAVDGLMDIKSVESDGFTCIMDDADPAQSFVWYAAFGDAVAAGGGSDDLGNPIFRSRMRTW